MNKERYLPQIGGVMVSPQKGDTRDDATGSESLLRSRTPKTQKQTREEIKKHSLLRAIDAVKIKQIDLPR